MDIQIIYVAWITVVRKLYSEQYFRIMLYQLDFINRLFGINRRNEIKQKSDGIHELYMIFFISLVKSS